jgi:hypothetical protein
VTERFDEPRESDEEIWQGATTLSPADTRDARIHVTLRLDPSLYRAITTEKKASKDRTITSTIERLLHKGLERSGRAEKDADDSLIRRALRNLVAHAVVQDAVLEMFSHHVKPRSSQEKRLVEEFKKHSCAPIDMVQWLTSQRETETASRNLVESLLKD